MGMKYDSSKKWYLEKVELNYLRNDNRSWGIFNVQCIFNVKYTFESKLKYSNYLN